MPGLVEKMGASPSTRMLLFVCVCVPLRLGLALAASRAHETRWFVAFAIAASLLTLYTTASGDSSVWWHRKVHAAHALGVLVLVAVLSKPEYVGHVLLSDVVFGVLTSLVKLPFS